MIFFFPSTFSKKGSSDFKLMEFKHNAKFIVIKFIQDKYLGKVIKPIYYCYIFFPKSKYDFLRLL